MSPVILFATISANANQIVQKDAASIQVLAGLAPIFRFNVAQEAPQPTPTPAPIPEGPGQSQQPPVSTDAILNQAGELKDGDSVLASDGSLYDEYTFEGKKDQQVTVLLESGDFDPYLAIFTPDNKLLEEHDDISEKDPNARITVTLPSDGKYRVIVNSYDEKGRGKYQLKVQ
ncbi:MAG: pre-peptidase C-terminal domain-containing protein [Microcoleaceae cyanobacterium]